MIQKTRCQDDIQHRIANRHRQRIAAKGGAMRTGRHAFSGRGGGKTRAHRKAAADAFGQSHDIGGDAGPLIGKEFAGPAHATLHLVENQQQAMPVAKLAQAPQALGRHHAHAAFALNRLDQNGGRFWRDGLLDGVMIGKRHLIEPFDLRAETIEIFLLPASRQGCERSAMERTFKRDDPEPLGMAGGRMVFARHLDRAFKRFGTRIGKKHRVGERMLDQTMGQPLAVGHFVEIGRVPELFGLCLQRLNQMRMGMAQRIDSDARAEIKIALAGC